ncbi:MAG TPA: hypothetical protein VLF94_02890 [Chlamydiales bacterium]|nr:hypothetical protein [Chlamydiales bacterium]
MKITMPKMPKVVNDAVAYAKAHPYKATATVLASVGTLAVVAKLGSIGYTAAANVVEQCTMNDKLRPTCPNPAFSKRFSAGASAVGAAVTDAVTGAASSVQNAASAVGTRIQGLFARANVTNSTNSTNSTK